MNATAGELGRRVQVGAVHLRKATPEDLKIIAAGPTYYKKLPLPPLHDVSGGNATPTAMGIGNYTVTDDAQVREVAERDGCRGPARCGLCLYSA